MLRIRKEQLATFEKHMHDKFVKEMHAHLCSEFPEESGRFEPKELHEFICRYVEDARANEIIYDPDIQGYLEVCLTHSPMRSEPRPQKVVEILKYPSRAGSIKIELLQNYFQSESTQESFDG